MNAYATARPDDIVPGTPMLTFRPDEGLVDDDILATEVEGLRSRDFLVASPEKRGFEWHPWLHPRQRVSGRRSVLQ